MVHRLAERGLIGYDTPVAEYWPEFAAHGKDDITVRDVLSHRAGLHRVRGLVPGREGILNYDMVVRALAASPPDPRRIRTSGYHAITFGWLVAEIVQRVTGAAFIDVVRDEIADPLGLDEFWFRVPESERRRIARIFRPLSPLGSAGTPPRRCCPGCGPCAGLPRRACRRVSTNWSATRACTTR